VVYSAGSLARRIGAGRAGAPSRTRGHDDRPSDQRTLILDGQPTPYFAQLAWPGLASLANLPATAAPIGQTKAGLPIGLQVIGPYLEDRTTLAFAEFIEREFGGFRPPHGR